MPLKLRRRFLIMMNLFSDDLRRDPYPIYEQFRGTSPVFHAPPPMDMWLIFDYDASKRVLNDFETFSSAVPAPPNWFIFFDPPQHTKLRALIAKAFTPHSIAELDPRIRALSRQYIDAVIERGEMDLVADLAIPLPMTVIAQMIGIPATEWVRFRHWSDEILKLSYTLRGAVGEQASADAHAGFRAVTQEMNDYLTERIAERRAAPTDDLLTRLVQAEVEGERLTQAQILGFFQLLIVAGQETTSNLISNAVLSLIENPEQLALLRAQPELLPQAIEEVLRYRSPLHWLMRMPRREVELHGCRIPAGDLILVVIGSANRDAKQFSHADKFDITRQPNPHIAFGHGIHACLGAALARMESKIVLSELLARFKDFELASSEPWKPREALHVHGPASLPIRFKKRPVAYLSC